MKKERRKRKADPNAHCEVEGKHHAINSKTMKETSTLKFQETKWEIRKFWSTVRIKEKVGNKTDNNSCVKHLAQGTWIRFIFIFIFINKFLRSPFNKRRQQHSWEIGAMLSCVLGACCKLEFCMQGMFEFVSTTPISVFLIKMHSSPLEANPMPSLIFWVGKPKLGM